MVLEVNGRKGASAAKSYYKEQEKLEGRDAWPPTWFGKGAERLGLSGVVDSKIFGRLIDNLMPDGKAKVTPRGGDDRIVLHDFTFNSPKGVSLAAEFRPDGDEIRRAFIDAVQETMAARIEPLAATRERAGGRNEDRVTGEVTGSLHVHSINREGEPHLHGHACVQGHTWHPEEGRFKALKVFGIRKSAPTIEEDFHRRFRSKVKDLGYATMATHGGKFWDIKGVPESAKAKFSSPRSRIEKLYDAKKAKGEDVTAALYKKSGIMVRKPKTGRIDLDASRKLWAAQLTPAERDAFMGLKSDRPGWGSFLSRAKRHHARVRAVQYGEPGKGVDHERQR
jgi:conjugative relaxase-like TrwC/TraI family protein